jgi:peptidoglycan hydrolase CwlO-like protein
MADKLRRVEERSTVKELQSIIMPIICSQIGANAETNKIVDNLAQAIYDNWGKRVDSLQEEIRELQRIIEETNDD